MQTQRKAQQANELSNLTRQMQLLASVNYRHAILEELERFSGNLVAYKTREHLKRIQKVVLVEMIELKKELRLQSLHKELLDIIDERCSFIEELEQCLPTNVMAYKTRLELKGLQKDDMIRAMEMSLIALQFHHQAMKGFDFYKSLIILGIAGIVQTAKLRKLVGNWEGGEESVMSIQEYIKKVTEDVGEDGDFTHAPWLSVIDYVNVDGGIVTGCFGDVKKFLKNGKLEKVVSLIKSLLRMR
nr:hypothetical protein [Tanacetum cinerariifolium]